MSPATINKDLRHIKAALRLAHEWGCLPDVPKVRMVKEPQRQPTFVTPEHFDLIYSKGCDLARIPNEPGQGYTPTDWWKALTVTAYMTGLRVGDLLAIKTEGLNLGRCELLTRCDTKADRDEIVPLHAVVVEHLKKIVGANPIVFPWGHDPRTLWVEFTRIQQEAGTHLTCREKHDHTPSCHVYGFHDFRRAFATVNAPRLQPEVLQRLMRHKCYQTTQKFYIYPANQMQDAMTDFLKQKPDGQADGLRGSAGK